jgi:hypothetical protein
VKPTARTGALLEFDEQPNRMPARNKGSTGKNSFGTFYLQVFLPRVGSRFSRPCGGCLSCQKRSIRKASGVIQIRPYRVS